MAEGFDAILIEREAEYFADIQERLAYYEGGVKHKLAAKHRSSKPQGKMPLFGE